MGLLGVIGVGLRAETKTFDKKIRKSKKGVSGFKMSLKGAAAGLGAMGAAVGAYKMVGVVKESMSAIDASAKLADRLGTTVGALEGLRHAAELTGAGAGGLDKGIEKMTRSIGEAVDGPSAAGDAIERLGINIDDLVGLDPATQFGIISDATNRLGTQSEKAAVSADIFGRSGMALVNTMKLGSEGLGAAAKEAEQLGVSYSRVDAAKVEMANDSLHKMGQAVKGIGNKITVALVPYIKMASDYLVDLAKSGGDTGVSVGGVVESMASGVSFVSDTVRGLQLLWKGTQVVIAGVATGVIWSINEIQKGVVSLINLVPGVEIAMSDTLQMASDTMKETTKDFASEFADLATKELPSSKVKSMFASMKKESNLAAKEIASNIENGATKGVGVLSVKSSVDTSVKETANNSKASVGKLAAESSRFMTYSGANPKASISTENKKQTVVQEKQLRVLDKLLDVGKQTMDSMNINGKPIYSIG